MERDPPPSAVAKVLLEPGAPTGPVDVRTSRGRPPGRPPVQDEGPGSPGNEGEGGLTRPRRARPRRAGRCHEGHAAGRGQVGHADLVDRGVGPCRPQIDPADDGDVHPRVRQESDALTGGHGGGWTGHRASRHRASTAAPADDEPGRCGPGRGASCRSLPERISGRVMPVARSVTEPAVRSWAPRWPPWTAPSTSSTERCRQAGSRRHPYTRRSAPRLLRPRGVRLARSHPTACRSGRGVGPAGIEPATDGL